MTQPSEPTAAPYTGPTVSVAAPSISEAALLAVYEATIARLQEETAILRAKIQESMRATDTTQMKPKINDQVVANISYSAGRMTPYINDETAFFTWVQVHRPDELTTMVSGTFRAHVLDRVRKTGMYADEDGLPVPWASLRIGGPYIMVTVTDKLKDALAQIPGTGLVPDVDTTRRIGG